MSEVTYSKFWRHKISIGKPKVSEIHGSQLVFLER